MDFKDKLASKAGKNRLVLKISLDGIKFFMRFLSLPVIRTLHPWTSYKTNQAAMLPINIELKQEDVLLPFPVVSEFIDKSSHRFIMDVCGCRRAYTCSNHPSEIGCLFMGESVLDISPGIGRLVTKEEAHGHVENAVAKGLVPVTGKVRVDNFIFNTPDRGRLLSLCFCCHCCCIAGSFKNLPVEQVDRMFPPIEGLRMEVTDACTGCGSCVEYCIFDAITIENGKAVQSAMCRQCGRCVTNCPSKAITISVDNYDFIDEMVARVSSYVDVT